MDSGQGQAGRQEEDGVEQGQGVGTVFRQHHPGIEVAETMLLSLDEAPGVEAAVGPHQPVAIVQ